MTSRVLLVDGASSIDDSLSLPGDCEVHTAPDTGVALKLCEDKGPFAVVVSVQDRGTQNGIDFLARLRQSWPDTTRIMVADYASLDLALEALHDGAVFRFLTKGTKSEELSSAVLDGIVRYQGYAEERLLTEQLQFSRETLISLTESLEKRLGDQACRFQDLRDVAIAVTDAVGIEDIATSAAQGGGRLLGGRCVEVKLSLPATPEFSARSSGRRPGEDAFVQPIQSTGTWLGEIRVEGARLTQVDQRLLDSLACVVALAASSEVHKLGLEDAQQGTVFALARLAERRDVETGNHLERVRQYCRLIAMGLREDGHHVEIIDEAFVHDLVLAAPLHDIGKVAVPDAILFKPSPLTDSEWQVMRQHPTIGAETLETVLEGHSAAPYVRVARDIALGHHERWDGGGYPQGLRGAQIPLSARIVTLADCYDALTSERPYKEAWTHDRAMQYIAEQKGKQFDPDAAMAFLVRSDEVDEIRRRLADEGE